LQHLIEFVAKIVIGSEQQLRDVVMPYSVSLEMSERKLEAARRVCTTFEE
jgi:hypothetical protein